MYKVESARCFSCRGSSETELSAIFISQVCDLLLSAIQVCGHGLISIASPGQVCPRLTISASPCRPWPRWTSCSWSAWSSTQTHYYIALYNKNYSGRGPHRYFTPPFNDKHTQIAFFMATRLIACNYIVVLTIIKIGPGREYLQHHITTHLDNHQKFSVFVT